ncbi:MAG: magnesium transporter [Planctomycetota bacterium]|nr:magnesium transporter [Planctomycetota bacterium]MDA1215205.1 magnesium transporter [Planctomycetota bacterium]
MHQNSMYRSLLLPDLRVMLSENDEAGLSEFCDALHPAVSAEVLEELESREAWRVLTHCDVRRQAEIFEFLDHPQQMMLVDVVERKELSKLIEAMSADERVDVLSKMDPGHVENLLPLMAHAERTDIRKLLSYPENSAGSIMTTDYASLNEGIVASEALEQLRHQAPDSETIYYVYIVDEGRRLRGIISLRELILSKPGTPISNIMNRDVISVRVDDDQESVAHELARFDFIAIPVVDNQNRLVGIVTHDDVIDVLQEEAQEDAYRAGAVQPMQGSYLTLPVLTISWNRGIWLVALLGAALMTAAVLNHYQSVSTSFVWMISFLPLVLASGGNAGTQSATLIIRAIAVEDLDKSDLFRLMKREILTATILGTTLMLLAFFGSLMFLSWSEASVLALTVFLVVVLGSINGLVFPLIFRRLGMDPALMSNPLIASLSDLIGVFIYFNAAVWLLAEQKA